MLPYAAIGSEIAFGAHLPTLNFELPAALAASAPPEERGLSRDGVRLLVSHYSTDFMMHKTFNSIIDYLDPGGEVVATMRASVGTFDDGKTRYVNAELPDAPWSTARLRHGDAVVRALPITSLSMRR